MAVIREALGRGLPANVDESLRKRLARCEDKTPDTHVDEDAQTRLTWRRTPSVENRVCSSPSSRFASSLRSRTSSWSARRPAACSPRRNRPRSLTSISQPALRFAASRTCRSWEIRGSRRTVEASVSAVLPQSEKDRRYSGFLALTDVWPLNRPCQTPRRRSP